MLRDLDPFFDSDPKVITLYRELLLQVRKIGPFQEKPTKLCMNLVRRAIFLSAEPQRKALRLTVKSKGPIRDERILRTSHMTAARWHNDFKIHIGEEIDPQLVEWIRASYGLCDKPSQPAVSRKPRSSSGRTRLTRGRTKRKHTRPRESSGK